MLVKPQGPEIDIPDKRGWRPPGPEGVIALTSANVKVVGVANPLACGHRTSRRPQPYEEPEPRF